MLIINNNGDKKYAGKMLRFWIRAKNYDDETRGTIARQYCISSERCVPSASYLSAFEWRAACIASPPHVRRASAIYSIRSQKREGDDRSPLTSSIPAADHDEKAVRYFGGAINATA